MDPEPAGGVVELAPSTTPAPDSTTFPSAASREAAPLRITTTLNGAVTVQFGCWPGNVTPAAPVPPPAATFVPEAFLQDIARAFPVPTCRMGAGLPQPAPKPPKNTGLMKIDRGLLAAPSPNTKATKWKITGTIENCHYMPVAPKTGTPITSGSIHLEVTVPPGSDCTNIAPLVVPTKGDLKITWNAVNPKNGKVKVGVAKNKSTTVTGFGRFGDEFPILMSAAVIMADPKSLFFGTKLRLAFVMDETAAQVAVNCAGRGGLSELHFTSGANVLFIAT